MFDLSNLHKEKYYHEAEKQLRIAALSNIEIDHDRIAIVSDKTVKVYTKKFTRKQVSANDLRRLKSIPNFTIVNDRYSKKKRGVENSIFEEGYFSLPL